MDLSYYHASEMFQQLFRQLLQEWFVYSRGENRAIDEDHPLVLLAGISQTQADEIIAQLDRELNQEAGNRWRHGYGAGPDYSRLLSLGERRAMAGEIVSLFWKTPEELATMGSGLKYNPSWQRGLQPLSGPVMP